MWVGEKMRNDAKLPNNGDKRGPTKNVWIHQAI